MSKKLTTMEVKLAKALTLDYYIEASAIAENGDFINGLEDADATDIDKTDQYIFNNWRKNLPRAQALNWALKQVRVDVFDTDQEDIFSMD